MDPLVWEIKFYEVGMRQEVTEQELEQFVNRQMLRHGMPRKPEPLGPSDALLPGDNPHA